MMMMMMGFFLKEIGFFISGLNDRVRMIIWTVNHRWFRFAVETIMIVIIRIIRRILLLLSSRTIISDVTTNTCTFSLVIIVIIIIPSTIG